MDKHLNSEPISHYRIIRKLGSGGMGDVYLAEDARLGRQVALKMLPEHLAADADRLSRFEQEARAASALNHPNILTVHEFGTVGTTHFLASEFVQGETIREKLLRGRLAPREALEVALQIASALQVAHEAGIVHRDIKPENVMVREDGYVKVLDFGLAKLVASSTVDGELPRAPHVQTISGLIVGTAAYMSPEQALGEPVDPRTDLFSLGVVLYEMLTGEQPFKGETPNHTLVAIVSKQPPPLSAVVEDVPSDLERIVEKALVKNPSARYATAKALSADLKAVLKRLELEAELGQASSAPARTGVAAQARSSPSGDTVSAATTQTDSIAVLPFTNMSADRENEYFCDGLAEDLIYALGKIEGLKVAARQSAFSFKGKNTNVGEIGRALGVRRVLDGSVRKSGNRIRIAVQLVNAEDGYHVWSERYDREMQDIFDVQDEITLAVVDALKVKLRGVVPLPRKYTDNADAYELYLKGRFQWNTFTEDGMKAALASFKQAVRVDPDYLLAYVGMADAYLFLGLPDAATCVLSPKESLPKARAAAERALAIDDSLAEGWTSLATIRWKEMDWAGAEEGYKRSLALNPNYSLTHRFYGIFLSSLGRYDEASRELRREAELDPLSPSSDAAFGFVDYLAGRTREAIERFKTSLERYAAFPLAWRRLGFALVRDGRYAEAVEALQQASKYSGDSPNARTALGYAYAMAGSRGDALSVCADMEALSARRYVSAYGIALIYVGLGETEQAFEWLERAFDERNAELGWLEVDPRLEPLREDARFRDLISRVGFPPSR